MLDFLSRSDGGAVLIRKTEVEETQSQSTFRLQTPSFHSARFSRPSYSPGMPNSLTTATVFLRQFRPFRRLRSSRSSVLHLLCHLCPCSRGSIPGLIFRLAAAAPRQNYNRKNHENIRTSTPGSTVSAFTPPGQFPTSPHPYFSALGIPQNFTH